MGNPNNRYCADCVYAWVPDPPHDQSLGQCCKTFSSAQGVRVRVDHMYCGQFRGADGSTFLADAPKEDEG